MKRYWLSSLFGVGIMCGLSSVVYAVDLEAVLKDNTANSGFSVKDASGNTVARFRGDGKVGIGTAVPLGKLEIATTNLIGGDDLLLLTRGAGYGGTYFNQYYTDVFNYGLRIGWTEPRLTINQYNGNVGIGTTTPEAKLSIQAVENMTNLLVHNRASNIPNASVWFRDTEGTPHNIFRATGDYDADAGGPYEFVINQSGNVGIGVLNPSEKLYVAGNILATGSISQGSSKELKKDIAEISSDEAVEALQGLNPVKYKYKADDTGEEQLGFIAEDVPDLVATKDHKRLSSMDITAVLTKVVQEQQKTIETMAKKIEILENSLR